MSKNYKEDENFMKLISKFDFGKGPWIYVWLEARDRVSIYPLITFDKEYILQDVYKLLIYYGAKQEYDEEEYYENPENVKEYGFAVDISINKYGLYMEYLKKEDYRNYVNITKVNFEQLIEDSKK